MSSSSIDVNRQARRLLVQHWVDLGRLSLHASNNTIYLRGTLTKIAGSESEFNPASLELMFTKLKDIPGIRFVQVDLDNWDRSADAGTWREKTVSTSEGTQIQISQRPDQGTAYKVE